MHDGTLTLAWLPVGLVAGAALGLVATLVMDVSMARLPEGETSPRVAAGTLADAPLDRAPDGVATAAHYGAGICTGVLFVAGFAAVQAVADVGAFLVLPVVAAVLFVLMNWFFSFVVVPAYGRVPDDRVGAVRRDWALSAATYLVAANVGLVAASAVVAAAA